MSKLQKHFTTSLESHVTTVSQEGFLDALKKLFSKKKEAKSSMSEDGELDSEDYKKALDVLGKSKAEIKKLKLKTGTIDGRWISRQLLGDKTTPDAVVHAVRQHMAVVDRVYATAARDSKALTVFRDKLIADHEKDPSFDIKAACEKAGWEKLNPLKLSQSDYAKLLPGTGISYFDEYKSWMVDEDDEVDTEAQRLPALTADDIVKLLDIADKAVSWVYRDKPKVDEGSMWGDSIVFRTFDGSDDPGEWLFHGKYIEEWGWSAVLFHLDYRAEQTEDAILTWIYRSIDQGDSVSTESFNERGSFERTSRRSKRQRPLKLRRV